MPEPRPLSDRLAIPLLLLAGVLLHLPWMFGPFGFYEINAGYFFGPFAQSWHEFGFLATRGVPLGTFEFRPTGPDGAFPYFNHPPLYAWTCALLGTSEWALRAPSVIAGIVAGPCLWGLLRPRLPATIAWIGALLLQAVPMVAFAPQMSYEAPVLGTGLLLLLAHERWLGGDRRWRRVVVATAVIGPWCDWSFAFFALALLPGSAGGGLGASLRRLWLPWGCYAASLAALLGWQFWARSAPFLRHDLPGAESFAEVLKRALLAWPDPLEFVRGLGLLLDIGFTVPLMIMAVPGLLAMSWRQPRLLWTLLLPGVLNIVVFRFHSYNHLMFTAFLAPTFALASAGSLQLVRERLSSVAATLAGVVLVGLATAATVDVKTAATQPLFARLGATLSEIADGPPSATDPRPIAVATNAEQNYPYYVRSPRVYLFPAIDVAALERIRGGPARIRYVYLHVERRVPGTDTPPGPPPDPQLHAWLQQFPRQPLPQLTGRWWWQDDLELVIHGAWVYDL